MRIAKTDARKRFSEVLTLAGYQGQRVLITHYGRTLAAIVPHADLRTLERGERRARREAVEPPAAHVTRKGRRAANPDR